MDLNQARFNMIEQQIRPWEVLDPQVLELLSVVRREDFVPLAQKALAFVDMDIPLGQGEVMLAPRVQARLVQDLALKKTDKVLEIGTGSGYQAAILSPLVKEVYSIEIVEPLGVQARTLLKRLKYDNVHVKIGDGFQGWSEHAPFDKIIVTCSPEKVPQPLVDQPVRITVSTPSACRSSASEVPTNADGYCLV